MSIGQTTHAFRNDPSLLKELYVQYPICNLKKTMIFLFLFAFLIAENMFIPGCLPEYLNSILDIKNIELPHFF